MIKKIWGAGDLISLLKRINIEVVRIRLILRDMSGVIVCVNAPLESREMWLDFLFECDLYSLRVGPVHHQTFALVILSSINANNCFPIDLRILGLQSLSLSRQAFVLIKSIFAKYLTVGCVVLLLYIMSHSFLLSIFTQVFHFVQKSRVWDFLLFFNVSASMLLRFLSTYIISSLVLSKTLGCFPM